MVHTFISITPISSQNPMFDHLFESYYQDDSNKWSNIGFCEDIKQVELIEVNFMHIIWGSDQFFLAYIIQLLKIDLHRPRLICI